MIPAARMAAQFRPIRRLLIANRGEIACRIMKTAKRMNIKTLAIYSSADRDSMHVKIADEAHHVGEPEPQRSYLNQQRIFELARRHSVSAIHPGYGFLSENAEFAERCQEEDLIFVGPSSSAIRSMGIKNESKRIMIEAGVPVVPGYHGLEQHDELLLGEARKIGYPVLIKPVRGGGGKGMRVVQREQDFMEALESARRESLKSFNDSAMLLERYIEEPRHVEVQIFADSHGNCVYLYERDCSVQRRHQKIIEEAPAPLLSDEKRRELGEKAVAAARAVNYLGAGTVEFILDKRTGEFFFMEMNTRLQVEHPITELITGTDLVEWQLQIASGAPIPKRQSEIQISGHAFEARIYAESPADNFLPQTGRLDYVSLPELSWDSRQEHEHGHTTAASSSGSGGVVRLDTGVTTGDTISPYYDPMIAKLIVWDSDRPRALERLRRALGQYVVVGVPTNIEFLARLAEHGAFQAADIGTDFIDKHRDELFADNFPKVSPSISAKHGRSPALALIEEFSLVPEICAAVYRFILSRPTGDGAITRRELDSFRIIATDRPVYEFRMSLPNLSSGNSFIVSYEPLDYKSGKLRIRAPDSAGQSAPESCSLEVPVAFGGGCPRGTHDSGDHLVRVELGHQGQDGVYTVEVQSPVITDVAAGQTMVVVRKSGAARSHLASVEFENVLERRAGAQASCADSSIARAPMPGIIERVLIEAGDRVHKGQSLVVMSAMKMEYTIKAAADALVESVNCEQGDFVARDSVLVRLAEPQAGQLERASAPNE